MMVQWSRVCTPRITLRVRVQMSQPAPTATKEKHAPAKQESVEPTDAQLDAATRAILRVGVVHGFSAMIPALFKHPVSGETLDYEESRMYYG